MFFLLSLLLLPTTVYTLTCASCPFHLQPPHPTVCNDTCEGDLCYIVVNKYFNGTLIAGCLTMKDGDEFRNKTAVCSRSLTRSMCACTTKDKCNSPMSPLKEFDFVEDDILEGYQVMPHIAPDANVSSQSFTSTELKEIPGDETLQNRNDSSELEDNTVSKRTRPAFPITSSSEIDITRTMGNRIGEINDERQTTRSMNHDTNSSEDDFEPLRMSKLNPPTVNPQATPIEYELGMSQSISGTTSNPTDSSQSLFNSVFSVFIAFSLFLYV